jgi:hypothetical protein
LENIIRESQKVGQIWLSLIELRIYSFKFSKYIRKQYSRKIIKLKKIAKKMISIMTVMILI